MLELHGESEFPKLMQHTILGHCHQIQYWVGGIACELHWDNNPPSLYSCCVRSLLLRELIRIRIMIDHNVEIEHITLD